MPGGLWRSTAGAGCVLMVCLLPGIAAADDADDVLVTVNAHPITQADLRLEALLRQVPEAQLQQQRESLIERLIELRLIAEFVAKRKARANPVQLESQQERIEALIHRRGEEPEQLFERLGIDRQRLLQRLELQLAWDAHVRRVTSEKKLRDYFVQHRRELDGTRLTAQHILIKADPDDAPARETARKQLLGLRQKIEQDEMTFEAAAAEHSQAPSAPQGGDVGDFGYRGTMPAEFADAAFALEVGEVSEPVETPFGVHLIRVTDERPGQLSPEDVRGQILQRISRDLWRAQIATDRPRAAIERP